MNRLFKKYFKLPFKIDGYSLIYVWDSDRHVVFNYLNGEKIMNQDDSEIKELIACINSELPGKYNAKAIDGIIYIDDNKKLMIRGWGRLTGTGACGLKLSTEEAIKVQYDIVDYCVKMLRRDL